MQEIITALKNALFSEDSLLGHLNQNSSYLWLEKYPVAVVHDKKRIKDEKIISWMEREGILDKNGLTLKEYDSQTISLMEKYVPATLKQVSLICLEGKNRMPYRFKEKRTYDYWKKIENPGNLKVVVEISHTEQRDICQIELELRDLMRSSKEVPVLKALGFVWVVYVPKAVDLKKLLRHYFSDNYEVLTSREHSVYIGWSDRLGEVNMRDFVCPKT
ncbi:MAG: hypothetical protein ABXS91_04230 [Sulfurimonas sp.]